MFQIWACKQVMDIAPANGNRPWEQGLCPLSLKKRKELDIGPRQVILSLVVDTNKITVGITEKYIQQVKDLLDRTDTSKRKQKALLHGERKENGREFSGKQKSS